MKFHCNHDKIIKNQFKCVKKGHSNFPNDFLYPYLGGGGEVYSYSCIVCGCGKLINAFYIVYPNFHFTFVWFIAMLLHWE